MSVALSHLTSILRLCVFAAFLAILGGCGPELSKNDLGTVVDEEPKLAGSDKPYPMPQLGPPIKEKQKSDDSGTEKASP